MAVETSFKQRYDGTGDDVAWLGKASSYGAAYFRIYEDDPADKYATLQIVPGVQARILLNADVGHTEQTSNGVRVNLFQCFNLSDPMDEDNRIAHPDVPVLRGNLPVNATVLLDPGLYYFEIFWNTIANDAVISAASIY